MDFRKGPWPDYRVPKRTLPCCGLEIDTMTLASGNPCETIDDMVTQENHQSVTVCIRCGQWLIVNPDFTHRLVDADDIVAMPDGIRNQLRRMTDAVHYVREHHKRK